MSQRIWFGVLCLVFAHAAVGYAQVPNFDHVFVIVMENQEFDGVVGNVAAPYINSLAQQNGLATNDFAITHPSLPNYMALTGGDTFFSDDCIGCQTTAPNLADRVETAGRTWTAYMEDMPDVCTTTDSALYVAKHNPFVHYTDIVSDSARCGSHVVPFSRFDNDLASGHLANFVWITPNLCHDMHDCAVATGDAWLSTVVPHILQSPAFVNSVLFLVWDEGVTAAGGGGHIPLVVVSPYTPAGTRVVTPESHYSLLRTIEDAWQLTPLGQSANADDLSQFFPALNRTAIDIVIDASDIPSTAIHGTWTVSHDATAANGIKLATPDNGWASTSNALAAPTDYVDVPVTAPAGIPYTFWIRVQALNNSKYNDSLWVQFSDASAGNSSIYPMHSTAALDVNLATDSTGNSVQGWGWVDGSYWLTQPATVTFTTSGAHTLRIQVREDGVAFDQIVLSPATYFNASVSCPSACSGAPGPVSNDHTIVPKPNALPPVAPASPAPTSTATGVGVTPTLMWTSVNATNYDVNFGATSPPSSVSVGQASASYTPAPLLNGTTYYWQVVAHNAAGMTSGPVWSFTTTAAAPSLPGTPTSPMPTDGATGVVSTPSLTWTASNATSYDIHFGRENPPPMVASGQTVTSYTPAALASNATYFWQITAHATGGTAIGPVWSFTTTAPPPSGTIVIYASDVAPSALHGRWTTASDPTSPNGVKLLTSDLGVTNTGALAAPTDYVDVTFNAPANTPYTVWFRIAALNDSKWNDSMWVQFSDAQAGGSAIYPLNTTQALLVNLATDATGSSDRGWGWVNGGYWLTQPATVAFATAGAHSLRIQVREDGLSFDQIVLSPTDYFDASASCPNTCAAAPGSLSNDHTIVPKS